MEHAKKPTVGPLRPAKKETLEYIQSMLEQLSRMAEFERATTLTYFMHMAYLECSDILRGAVTPGPETAKRPDEPSGAIARRA